MNVTWRTSCLNLLLVACSLALGFISLEVAVRIFVDIEADGPLVVEGTQDAFSFIPDQKRTYETLEYRFSFEINSHGRRDIEWAAETIADPRNVLFVGDSFVFGIGVGDEETLPTLLEASDIGSGSPIEVFNFGMPGADPLQYRGLLQRALEIGVQAKTIVVGIFVGNDFYPNVLDPRPPQPITEEPDEELRAGSYLLTFLEYRVSRSARLVGWMLTLGRLLGINIYDRAGSFIFLRRQTPEQHAFFREVLEVMGETKQIADLHSRDLYWVIIPSKLQVENGDDLTGSIYDAGLPNRLIVEYCHERTIPCLDLLPILASDYKRRGELLYFNIDRHLTPAGNRLVARAISDFLGQYEVSARPVPIPQS